MIVPRYYNYEYLEKYIQSNAVLFLQGGSQVGKTTLVNAYISASSFRSRTETGSNVQLQELFDIGNPSRIESLVEGYDLLVIEDAHFIQSLHHGLRVLCTVRPDLKIVAVSSFDVVKKQTAPFPYTYTILNLYPVTVGEFVNAYTKQELVKHLEDLLLYGCYPAVTVERVLSKKKNILQEIVGSYLIGDLLSQEKVKGANVLLHLLRILAFSIGTDISLTAIGKQLAIDRKTVSRYLTLLEKAFIVFKLQGFTRKTTREIHKTSKYFFYDTGVRNALIESFNPLNLRDDVDKLWANFIIAERIKTQHYQGIPSVNYFWRNWNHKTIDWIEERDRKLFTYAFSYKNTRIPVPKEFKKAYSSAEFKLIYKDNFLEFTTK